MSRHHLQSTFSFILSSSLIHHQHWNNWAAAKPPSAVYWIPGYNIIHKAPPQRLPLHPDSAEHSDSLPNANPTLTINQQPISNRLRNHCLHAWLSLFLHSCLPSYLCTRLLACQPLYLPATNSGRVGHKRTENYQQCECVWQPTNQSGYTTYLRLSDICCEYIISNGLGLLLLQSGRLWWVRNPTDPLTDKSSPLKDFPDASLSQRTGNYTSIGFAGHTAGPLPSMVTHSLVLLQHLEMIKKMQWH